MRRLAVAFALAWAACAPHAPELAAELRDPLRAQGAAFIPSLTAPAVARDSLDNAITVATRGIGGPPRGGLTARYGAYTSRASGTRAAWLITVNGAPRGGATDAVVTIYSVVDVREGRELFRLERP